jgi:hypothetical protein
MANNPVEFKVYPATQSGDGYTCRVTSDLLSSTKTIHGSSPQIALQLAEDFCRSFGTLLSRRAAPALASAIPAPPVAHPVLVIIVLVSIVVWEYISRSRSRDDECYAQYLKEIKTCSFLSDHRMRNSCERQVTQRYAACLAGKPLPPLFW